MPRIRMRDESGTLRTLSRIRMRDESNVLRTITRIRMRDADNVLRTVWDASGVGGSLAAPLNKTNIAGQNGGFSGNVTATSDTVTVSPTGGTGPYTYLWEVEVTNAYYNSSPMMPVNDVLPTNPNDPTSAVFVNAPVGWEFSGTFTVTVTDSLGATATNSCFFDLVCADYN